ncbi:hypothetical protein [Mycoplasma phocimorsus]|uniref:hypothetical protein n=1 Tax=Mycoplasma phocimorsus TaxID=3045839 RepID=UPI0024BF7BEC|nr:hypothetical protein [Mycoplasma phocimorsus]MDJ1646114.1 hypothetical protein [Mycoplasma phocimorsus]MDJ1647158.1 hypothetical protein [Mycoplasma phocimorsus]MDJ1648224.1 hypothetical protein [Mycoplasma phocimorsus]
MNNVKNTLDKIIASGQVSHCYIFYSTKQVDIEKWMLYFYNQLSNDNIKKLSYDQVFNNSVSLINFPNEYSEINTGDKAYLTESFQKLYLMEKEGSYKYIFIKDFDLMSKEAIGYTLKLIEEPPAFSRILISTRNLELLPKTIQSRGIKIKIPDFISKEEEQLLIKDIDSNIALIVLEIYQNKEQIAAFLKKFNEEKIKELIKIFIESTKNKYKLGLYLEQNLDYKSWKIVIDLLLLLLRNVMLKNGVLWKKYKNKLSKVKNFNIDFLNVFEKINKLVFDYKKTRYSSNFFVWKEVLIMEIMESYYE